MATLAWSINNARGDLGVREFGQSLRYRKLSLMGAIEEKLGTLGEQLYALVEEKLSGEVLQTRTGALLTSVVLAAVVATGTTFETWVEIPESSPQHLIGLVHEFGGEGYYIIEPVEKQALAFVMGGETVIRRRVNHPPAIERSYLRSSLAEIEEQAYAELNAAVESVLEAS